MPPNLRPSVMTHIAWVPRPWLDRARTALAGMAERHPSRTILLVPEPNSGESRIDAQVSLECYAVPDVDRNVCSEVIELTLLGNRAAVPASIVEPLLIADLPVFVRWRGEPPWGAPELEQLVDLTDRLVVDSTEWEDLPHPYSHLVELFERTAVSDIAWARTSRWREHLATLWPGIAGVGPIRVRGTAAQGRPLLGRPRSPAIASSAVTRCRRRSRARFGGGATTAAAARSRPGSGGSSSMRHVTHVAAGRTPRRPRSPRRTGTHRCSRSTS